MIDLGNGQYKITNNGTGETRVVTTQDLPKYGLSAPSQVASQPPVVPQTNAAMTHQPVQDLESTPQQPRNQPFVGGVVGDIIKNPGDALKALGHAIIDPAIYAGKTYGGIGYELKRKAEHALGNKDVYSPDAPKNPFLSEEDFNKPVERGVKSAAAVGSYLVPGGKTLAGAVGTGAVRGGLYGTAAGEDIDPNKVIGGTVGGAAASGLVYGAGKLISGAGKKTSEKLMDEAFKEPLKQTRAGVKKGITLGKEALERGEKGTSEQIYTKAISKINTLEDDLQNKLASSDKTISIKKMFESVDPLVKRYEKAGNLNAAAAIRDRIDTIAEQNGQEIPAAAANIIKRTLYDEARKSYGTQSGANMEGVKAIARAIKESLDEIPGTTSINKDLGFYGRVADSMTDKLARTGRNDLLGLGDLGAGTIGTIAAGGPGGVVGVLGKKMLGTTIGQTMGANAISKTLPPIGEAIASPITQQVAGTAGGYVGSSLTPESSFPPIVEASDSPSSDQNNQDINNQMVPPITSSGDSVSPDTSSLPSISQDTVTGHSLQEHAKAYQQALIQGDMAAATQIKNLYDMENDYQKQQKTKEKPQQINPTAQMGMDSLVSLERALGYKDATGKDIPNAKMNKGAVVSEKLTPGGGPVQGTSFELARALATVKVSREPTPQQIEQIQKNYLPSILLSEDENKRRINSIRKIFENFKFTKPVEESALPPIE